MAKTVSAPAKNPPVVDFEHSLDELEQLVGRMEGGELSLDESLAQVACRCASHRPRPACQPALEKRRVISWMGVQRALESRLPAAEQSPAALHRAMRYAELGGGKRLRPLLVYAAAHAFGEDGPQLDGAACAVELIHAYSLVHDDLPWNDDDAPAPAPVPALAFEILSNDPGDASIGMEKQRVLGRACGAEGMAGGQALDLAAVGQSLMLAELEHMHACKTGALIRASVRLGALGAGASAENLQLLDRYGDAVGLALTLVDQQHLDTWQQSYLCDSCSLFSSWELAPDSGSLCWWWHPERWGGAVHEQTTR
ncbi:MAG: hypothetical protein WDW38_002582 [Sanguina aurantia]